MLLKAEMTSANDTNIETHAEAESLAWQGIKCAYSRYGGEGDGIIARPRGARGTKVAN